jgi:hypothetical protein
MLLVQSCNIEQESFNPNHTSVSPMGRVAMLAVVSPSITYVQQQLEAPDGGGGGPLRAALGQDLGVLVCFTSGWPWSTLSPGVPVWLTSHGQDQQALFFLRAARPPSSSLLVVAFITIPLTRAAP